jgi:dihydroflavonol-4-reductase
VSEVVVTGATGHVGANLVRALLARGDRVRALVRNGGRALDGLDLERVGGDIRDEAVLCEAFDGAEIVYHAAALISLVGGQGGLVHETNVEGTRLVARAARTCGVRRLVYFCSVHAFDQQPLDLPVDETRRRVRSSWAPVYDRTKAAAEAEVRRAIGEGLDAVIVHPSGIVGPNDFGPSRMGRLLLDLCHRSLPALVDGGFDFVDVRDVVDGAIAAAERGRTAESYILSGAWHSMTRVAELCGEVTGVRPPRMCSPMWLARVGAPFMDLWYLTTKNEPLFTRESLAALRANRTYLHDKAARELGYAPRPFTQTVADTYRWFAEEGRLPSSVASRVLESVVSTGTANRKA